ncbi:hypothetical protein DSO57_1010515 [Entomophthora muscae]|uniref:Uncharacterized protein n=1 Tax=Entomophthora muscae TaxID=34485 RepID=A0ACC2U4Y5_9FUNG|nr:hypothetical protein DSO57_1010515 [Entomophthora muscae]
MRAVGLAVLWPSGPGGIQVPGLIPAPGPEVPEGKIVKPDNPDPQQPLKGLLWCIRRGLCLNSCCLMLLELFASWNQSGQVLSFTEGETSSMVSVVLWSIFDDSSWSPVY